MTDVFLFAASVALSFAFSRRRSSDRSGTAVLANYDDSMMLISQCRQALIERTSLQATELVCAVTEENKALPSGILRADMRLHNLWHRATYVLIVLSQDDHDGPKCISMDALQNTIVFVQRRSAMKDYCPLKLDPLPGGVVGFQETYRDNAVRELQEEMAIDVSCDSTGHSLKRVFSFPYQDDIVRVWGDFYECHYTGRPQDLVLQEEEVEDVMQMTLHDLREGIETRPDDFMPDACHALRLYFQRLGDIQVKRRLLKGYSSGNLDSYRMRPKPQALFFDCDDCLYFDGWITARHLTEKIDHWCVMNGLKQGQAYDLYKKYGTALRGLLAEGYIENTEQAIDAFLQEVHDIPVHKLLSPDDELRRLLLRMDPTIPKYVFTASVKDHADRCLQALGIADLFVAVIDCKACNLETKHSRHSFERAMHLAGIAHPENCIFFDDNLKNIEAARHIGWRSVLVGTVGRDCGKQISTDHAEHEIERIHLIEQILPELFISGL